jgi:hypothetical protein
MRDTSDPRWWRRPAEAAAALALLAGCGEGGSSKEEVPWRLLSDPGHTDLEIEAEFGGGSCTEFESWAVDQTETRVEVLAVIVRSDDDGCTDDLVVERLTVELDAPLGDRPLLGCDPADRLVDCAASSDP